MRNAWNDNHATEVTEGLEPGTADYLLQERVYSSRIIGKNPDLVLHGGGNTSVKVDRVWPDGKTRRTLHVKGSGWDLATIEAPGLPALALDPLLKARKFDSLSDPEMVKFLRDNLLDGSAPNPSVETLLHAFIPDRFVDHTHAVPSLVLANQPNAEEICKEIYGNRVAFVPYVMPGYDLSIEAAKIVDAHPDAQGLFLKNHGLFSYGPTAKIAYERMVEFVTIAEEHLARKDCAVAEHLSSISMETGFSARLKDALGTAFPSKKNDVCLDFRSDANVLEYLSLPNLQEISRRGTATPDHVIRIKPFPLICSGDDDTETILKKVHAFGDEYKAYFDLNVKQATEPKTMLAPVPMLVLVPRLGIYGVGMNRADAAVAGDLMVQTTRIVVSAERYGKFQPICQTDLFNMEYWSLEQAKLAKKAAAAE